LDNGEYAMKSPLRIMLVDDHHLLRQAVSTFLEEENIIVICEASSGEQLLSRLESGPMPDAVLMDIDLPGLSGIETAQKLQEINPNLPVICMSVRDDPYLIAAVLQSGACGYVRKDSTVKEFALTIAAAYTHHTNICSLVQHL
jgi:two-component system NarL family response regulator